MKKQNSKKDAFYFSHDANALSDPKILSMRCDYKLEGYGLFWAIIEFLRNQSDYKLPLNKTTYRAIKMQTGTDINIESFINDCINEYIGESGHGLFDSDDEYFWSNSLLNRMTKFEEVKEKRRQAANARWKNNANEMQKQCKCIKSYYKSNANAYHLNSKCSAKYKKLYAKLCKENKKKENKKKENKREIYKLNTTQLNLFFNYILNLEEKFEDIQEADKIAIISIIKKLDIFVPFDYIYMFTEEKLLDLKIQYWTIKELHFSPYKIYLKDLKEDVFMLKYLQSKERIQIDSESKITELVSYFIKCLINEFTKN